MKKDKNYPTIVKLLFCVALFVLFGSFFYGCVHQLEKQQEKKQAIIQEQLEKRKSRSEEFGRQGIVVAQSSFVSGRGRNAHAVASVILENPNGERIEVRNNKCAIIGDSWTIIWNDHYYASLGEKTVFPGMRK